MPIPLRAVASIVLLAAMTAGASAAASSANSHPCAQVTGAQERLVCYDRAFPPADGQSALDLKSETEQGLRDFGLNRVQMREREPERMRGVMPDRIQASVTRVTTLATRERVVALDNGQVWRLTEGTSKGPLKDGDNVAIREAAMGTYMLVTPNGMHLRTRRIQ